MVVLVVVAVGGSLLKGKLDVSVVVDEGVALVPQSPA